MGGNGYTMGWGMWLLMALGTLGFWILVAVVAAGLMRGSGRSDTTERDPLLTLNERLAKGDIDPAEYQYRRRLIVDGHPQDQPWGPSNPEARWPRDT